MDGSMGKAPPWWCCLSIYKEDISVLYLLFRCDGWDLRIGFFLLFSLLSAEHD